MTKSEYQRLCASKRGREQCVNRMRALAKELGASIEVRKGWVDQSELWCEMSGEGFSVSFSFHTVRWTRCYLGHWNASKGVRFPDTFGFTVGGDVNDFHFGKATTCVDTIVEFEGAIRRGFEDMKRRLVQAS
jgi:hypothetical protein